MDYILDFLKEYDYIFTVISTIVSLVTLLGVIQFKKRYQQVTEKQSFSSSKKKHVNELKGYILSLADANDGINTIKLLKDIDFFIHGLLVNYSFFSFRLKCQIRFISFCIQKIYKKEAMKSKNDHIDTLRKQLQGLLARLEKEEEHI